MAWTPITEAERESMHAGCVSRVLSSFTAGTRLQAEHLHQPGHRKLGFATIADRRFSLMSQGRANVRRLGRRAGDASSLRSGRAWRSHKVSNTQELMNGW
ncbi:DNA-binding LacI/PurR family transcriptional regulator [Actinomadura namibiensis]|uniref:DNA-binding LacI/PurR family transcriptional regulator n=1 Tax=Actinomadura namibiensis TaxID=182080 RepID=A0A7W3LZZ3_ACTNM|nr:DNA-binding LacI/PurR family transcriptional regulator [Actinomadura namibiensis]